SEQLQGIGWFDRLETGVVVLHEVIRIVERSKRSGQRCRDRLAEPRVQLAMPATVYVEPHKPQSGLRHQRRVELVQPRRHPRRHVDAAHRTASMAI
ncbi:MAG TPA: hypothetical protein VFP01_06020, partial [Propionibacteriaceae bacterium]|nr:hypothetical protein [Propionibacteriaceae bacterium]